MYCSSCCDNFYSDGWNSSASGCARHRNAKYKPSETEQRYPGSLDNYYRRKESEASDRARDAFNKRYPGD